MTITAEQAQALKAGITPGPWEIDAMQDEINRLRAVEAKGGVA